MQRERGFTLVELMVAVAILAVIGSMSWLGLDALWRSQAFNNAQSLRTTEVQIALGQWSADVGKALAPAGTQAMGWDGKVFRLTRRADLPQVGVVVVGWAVRSDGHSEYLMRWQSGPILTGAQWRAAWEEAAQWARGGALGSPAKLMAASGMDIQEWAPSGAWANGLSTRSPAHATSKADAASSSRSGDVSQPLGLRLLVHSSQGTLRKDWVNFGFSVVRS